MKKIIGLLVMIGLCIGMVGCSENNVLTTDSYKQNENTEVEILGTEFTCIGTVISHHYGYEAVVFNLKCNDGTTVYNIQNFIIK